MIFPSSRPIVRAFPLAAKLSMKLDMKLDHSGCLHCGNCYRSCPVKAVVRLGKSKKE